MSEEMVLGALWSAGPSFRQVENKMKHSVKNYTLFSKLRTSQILVGKSKLFQGLRRTECQKGL